MKAILKNILIIALAVILSACAAMQIDVDVYKGPLSDQHDVQDEQLMSLAVTSKKLLEDLQRRLMKGVYLDNDNKRTEFRKKKKSSSLMVTAKTKLDDNDIGIVYGHSLGERCTKSFRENNWVIEKGINSADEKVASVSMACNLEELLGLFEDDGGLVVVEFVKKIQSTIDNVKGLVAEEKKKGNTNEKHLDFDKVNKKIRAEINTGLSDTLNFLGYLKEHPEHLGHKQPALEVELEEMIAYLVNPKLVSEAISMLNFTHDEHQLDNLKKYDSTPYPYKEESSKLEKNLKNADYLVSFIELTRSLNRKCFKDNTNKRLCDTGFARGVSALGSTDKYEASFDKMKSLITSIINMSTELNESGLIANRDSLGIVSLEKEFRLSNPTDIALKDRLHRMLLNYAGKLLVLADKQVLLGDKYGKRSASQKYTQVLQSIGTAIVIQINEMKAQNQHEKKSEAWQSLDADLANQFFIQSSNSFKQHVLAGLKREKVKLSTSMKANTQLKNDLKNWLAKKTDIENVKFKLTEMAPQLKAVQNAILSLDNIKNKGLEHYNTPVKVTDFSQIISQTLEEDEPIKDSDNSCDSRALGEERDLCSNKRDLQWLVKDFEFNETALENQEKFEETISTLTKLFTNQKNILIKNIAIEKTKVEAFNTDKTNIAKQLEKQGGSSRCKELNDTCLTLLGVRILSVAEQIDLYQKSIEHVSKLTIKADQEPSLWAEAFLQSTDKKMNVVISNVAKASLKYGYLKELNCPKTLNNGDKCEAGQTLDSVIRYMENLVIHLQSIHGENSDEVNNAELALTSAYDLRARRQYLTPTSSYLRSSYPSSSLQKNNSASDWTNMLQMGAIRSVPLIGGAIGTEDNPVQQQVDKQFWQNINRVRVTGAGDTNYVVVKDDIGNWYVKNYSSDSTEVYNSLSNMAVANIASKAGSFVSTNEGVLSLKNSSNVLDVMYAKFFEKYQQETKAQFASHLLWLENEKWKSVFSKNCELISAKGAQLEATFNFAELHSKNKKITDNDTSGQGKAISSLIDKVANYTNALVDGFDKDKLCKDDGTLKVIPTIEVSLYKEFVTAEKKKREKVITDFENKILFVSEGLPESQSPSLLPVETE